ncbi:MAG: putative membrane protein, partial [Kiritimatiellia bacterium]
MKLSARIEVARPIDEVFAYLSNFENNPIWQAGMESARWTSEPPLRVGSTYVQLARFMGREIRSNFEVVAYSPGRSVRIKTVQSTFDIDVTRSCQPLQNGGTLVTAAIDGVPLNFPFSVFNPLMAW